MSFKVYIKPFDPYGEYAADYIDVTKDVDDASFSALSQKIEGSDFDLGVYVFGSLPLTMKNEHGLYSDVDAPESIFQYRRNDSLVKITYMIDEDSPYAGVGVVGRYHISPEIFVFEGLLNDESLELNLEDQKVKYTVISKDSVFSRVVVDAGDVNNGDLISEAILAILNKTAITKLLTVDVLNINPGIDQTIDDATDLENRTVKEALDELLAISNSVLRINSASEIIVSDRAATADVKAYFYGQASLLKPENIKGIKSIRNGVNRTFNFLTWSGTTIAVSDGASAGIYGVRKKEIGSDLFTNSTKQTNVLDNVLAEFANPKQEMELIVPITYANLALELLDKVSIDYPRVLFAMEGDTIPICGLARYDVDYLPGAVWSFELSPDDFYKIISKKINRKNDEIIFTLREA